MQPSAQKPVFFTTRAFVREIHRRGLPTTVTAAGSGVKEVIRTTFDVAAKGRHILQVAAACEGGFIFE